MATNLGEKQNPPPMNEGSEIVPLVIADLEGRRKLGLIKYGQLLRVTNGRDGLLDLYQELLDACLYIRQLIEQDREKSSSADTKDTTTEE